MNKSLTHLSRIAAKEERLIVGLMSGTSLDGLDIALCRITGSGRSTTLELVQFATVPYTAEASERLQRVVSVEQVSLRELCLYHTWLGTFHGSLVNGALKEWGVEPESVDCIASHGQTVYHAPASFHRQPGIGHTTLQIGDADHITRETGILTVSDFRQAHTAAGGEGAPLAALADDLLFRSEAADRLLLNIGGIANFTWLAADGRSISTDCGPGNTLLNNYMQRYLDRPFDRNGRVGAKGTVDRNLLDRLKDDPWFQLPMPRSSGPELFSLEWVEKTAGELPGNRSHADVIATLTLFSAETIADSVRSLPADAVPEIYVSGGGIHNRFLMQCLSEQLGKAEISSFRDIGFDPDAKEAACFAVLANELLAGEGFPIEGADDPQRPVPLGKISFPPP